jgi:hypothetical protein
MEAISRRSGQRQMSAMNGVKRTAK